MTQINIPVKLRILHSNEDIAKELFECCQEFNATKIAFISSKTPSHIITDELEKLLLDKLEKVKTYLIVNALIANINQIPLDDFDLVVGVGGGQVIDAAKYAADINKLPCISIPTTCTNDGICSPISVLKEKQNQFKSIGVTIPLAMLVPLHLIKNAEEESTISGVGDLLSNISAILDWELAHKKANEYLDDYAVIIAKTAALTVLNQANTYMLKKKSKDEFVKANIEQIINSLALSGIAMEIAGTSRPASGAEHLISHSIDALYGHIKPHGIQVAFGTYVTSLIRNRLGLIPDSFVEELKSVLHFLGIPISLHKLGLNKEQLINAIINAPNTRPNRYTILNEIPLDKQNLEALLKTLFI